MSIFTGLVHRSASSVPTAAATMRTKMTMIMNNNPSSSSLFSSVASSNNKLMPTRIRQLLQSQQQSLTNKIKRFSTTTTAAPVGGGTVTRSSTSSSALSSASSSASSSSTTSKSGSGKIFSFLKWYEHHLSKSPITTKMISGAFLWGIGDLVAQIIPQIIVKNDDGESQFLESSSSSSSTSTTSASINSTYISTTTAYPSIDDIVSNLDWIRTGKAVLFGFAIHAPASHGHFNLLEYMTKQLKLTGLSIPIFKTIMEQFIYWSWISNSMYHSYMGIMDGLSPSQIYNKLEAVLWDTQKAQWMFWIPIQLLNFQFIPIRHQLNVVLVTSIVWTALLSMWYPPPSVPVPVTTTKEEESEKSTTTTTE
jgi:hypothetical protein